MASKKVVVKGARVARAVQAAPVVVPTVAVARALTALQVATAAQGVPVATKASGQIQYPAAFVWAGRTSAQGGNAQVFAAVQAALAGHKGAMARAALHATLQASSATLPLPKGASSAIRNAYRSGFTVGGTVGAPTGNVAASGKASKAQVAKARRNPAGAKGARK